MLCPLPLQGFDHIILALRVDDVHIDRVILQETVGTVDCLNKILKFVIDTQKDIAVAVPLEVASGSCDLRFGCQDFDLAMLFTA